MSDSSSRDSSEPVFEARGLKMDYDGGKVAALRGVDFTIRSGEFVAITGPSGCGKSTLLSMLGSLDKPTAGTLTYRGKSIPDLPDPPGYRAREIGFIFQAFHLINTFNVLENVQIPMFEGDLDRAGRHERAVSLLKMVGLDHRLAHFPTTLSGGERQRVAIARSLANSPGVILADEPTGNLDSANSAQIMELLVKLHREIGMTLVLVTHDPNVASQASRIIRMKDGQVESDQPRAAQA